MNNENVYHVIALSNFARGFDKYQRCYDKTAIPESTFPDQTFVLTREELPIGIQKASGLLTKLNLAGNRLLVLEARLPTAVLKPNLRTGRGRFIPGPRLPVAALWFLQPDGELSPVSPEEAYAASMALLHPQLSSYEAIQPRSVSVLPIARACQAACKFCFSESSASVDQVPMTLDPTYVADLCQRGAVKGAERFVITGGGEPGLLPHNELLALIGIGTQYLKKTVLITNGVHLSKQAPDTLFDRIRDYAKCGLSVLAVSRHHHDAARNQRIMGLDTRTERIMEVWREGREGWPTLRTRLICVLQQGGVEDEGSLEGYVNWAVGQGVEELCFKELYVSTTLESAYHSNPENQWSRDHQVSLALITRFFTDKGFTVVNRLPWGAPIFAGTWNGKPLQVAAYTEPSLFWERANGVARSWNIMANGECLVSLEDPHSALPGTCDKRTLRIKDFR